MMIFVVEKSHFYTEEYDLTDVVMYFDSLEKAKKYVLDTYDITISELGEFEILEADDDDLGEIHIGITAHHLY